jgi:tRNA 2-thiouridine synthesizing protein C
VKRLLVLVRRAPHGAAFGREALDAILATAAFDVPLTVLFDGDGVFQLLAGQDGAAIGEKNTGANWEALPMFDVEDLHASAAALAERGLGVEDLTLPVTVADDAAIRALIADADVTLGF